MGIWTFLKTIGYKLYFLKNTILASMCLNIVNYICHFRCHFRCYFLGVKNHKWVKYFFGK